MAQSYLEISDPSLLQSTLERARKAGTPLKYIKGDGGKPAAFLVDENLKSFRKSIGKGDAGAVGSKIFMSAKDIPSQKASGGANFDKPSVASKAGSLAGKAAKGAVDVAKKVKGAVDRSGVAGKVASGLKRTGGKLKNQISSDYEPKYTKGEPSKPSGVNRSSSGRSVQVFDKLSKRVDALEKQNKQLVDERRKKLNVSNYKERNPSPSRRMPLPPPSTKPMVGVESEKVPMSSAIRNRAARGVSLDPPQSGLSNQQDSANMRLKFKTQQMRDAMGYPRPRPTPSVRMSGLMGPLGLVSDFNSLVDESMREQGIIDYAPVPPAKIPTGTYSPSFEYPEAVDRGGSMEYRPSPDMTPNPNYKGKLHYLLHGTDPIYGNSI